jgi:hypothetical protein
MSKRIAAVLAKGVSQKSLESVVAALLGMLTGICILAWYLLGIHF